MATEALNVNAVTAPDQWALGAGANKVVAVNSPDNADTSYISSTTLLTEQYSLAASTIPAGSTITSVSGEMRIRYSAGSGKTIRVNLILGANTSNGPTHASPAAYTTYTDAIARPGGGAWQLADLASLQVAIQQTQSGSGTVQRCTTLRVIVDYTPPANTGQMFQVL